ncbi:PepSY domain-containing protein [Paucilactobacillus suebicus]|uniref:Small secreted protein-like protein n=1 Tax=Paucilactobacillus suebicus DSM 5007 = KCTC 3549 TaxID=1423807 RepID=A0A0R1WBC5_9LACO|nr:PepSY domain-containing protein [Paucilactobacillus suebicus]KRM13252.1 small secreted protein-like protein [Paucilactobacillus suebicus DSM 5007 = KCTC 3549]
MNNSQNQLNSWTLPISLGVSGVLGFFIGHALKNRQLSPSDILTEVKNLFRQEGPIEGSWIESKTVPFQRFAYKVDAYQGGISRYEDDQLVSYEFLADAKTGSVLKMQRIED